MPSLLANFLAFGLLIGFAALSELNPDLYYQNVQEDQPLEWMTFWAFIVAAFFYIRAAVSDRRLGKLPWFLVGLAAFCIVVAMEEISWGQRLLGYQPPRYFLENNYQQELNIHNVISTGLRKNLVGFVLLAYGVALPLLDRIPPTRKLLDKLQIVAPPLGLAPIFVALAVLLVTYPLRYTGELIEVVMGLAFLFASYAASSARDEEAPGATRWPVLIGALSAVVVLGFGGALWSRGQLAADPIVADVAKTEIRAIEQDLRGLIEDGTLPCGKHERLNLMARVTKSDRLAEGEFRSLVQKGLPEERAEFFIDPWATAYWVRTTCNSKRTKVYVYSFGPNRRRDSKKWKRRDDDIGRIFRVKEGEESVATAD